jgi:hypothetical protein
VPPSYTDSHIRELCAKVLVCQGDEFKATIAELRQALRDRIEALSNLAVAMTLQIPEVLPGENGNLFEAKEKVKNR